MPLILRAILAGSLGLLTAGLAACGSSGPGLLNSGQSSALNSRLSELASDVSQGHCGKASAAAASFQGDVAQLPASVNSTLRANLIQGASTIAQLTPRTCSQSTTTPTTTTSTQPTTTTSTTPTTTTSTTPTTTTDTGTTPPPPTTTTSQTTTTSTTGGTGLGGSTVTTPSTGGAGASGNTGNGQ